jgi:glyoxylase-like metal-dependent hydrolase (beta-lactamase superfamily II)
VTNDLKNSLTLNRRNLLKGSAAATAAVALGINSRSVIAAEDTMVPNAIKYGFKLGDMDVSTLLAGSRIAPEPQTIFGKNVSSEEFASVSAENFLPIDQTKFFFTPTVVKVGDDIVLFDTGFNPDSIGAPLRAAGIEPDDVTVVVITHMHGDHIGGLTGEGGEETFKNARYVTGEAEFDAWSKQDNDNFKNKVAPLAEKMEFLKDGSAVVSGITAMAAFGHTPGHMTYMLESGGKQLVIAADTANHYVWSLAYPDWEVKFDMDKAAAAATRKQVFGMLAADKVPFIGYHMPFPGTGFVETRGEGGFRYVPASYQLDLG